MKIFDEQPAIIRTEADAAFAIVKTLRNQAAESLDGLGRALLDAKSKCPHGEWLPRLKKLRIGLRTAQRLMEKASRQIRHDDVFELEDEAAEVETPPAVQPVLHTAPTSPPAVPAPTIFCRECRLNGPRNKCRDCAELRKPAAPAEPERQPGDDTKQTEADKNKPKPGAVVWDQKEFNGYVASQTRLIDRVARAGGLVDSAGAVKQTPEIASFHRRLQELQNEVGNFARAILKKINSQAKSPVS